MSEPWGITDLGFAKAYAVGLAVALLVAFAARILVRAVPGAPGPVDTDEAGYLRAGPHHVVEAALTRLIDHGHLRVLASGELRVAPGAAAAGPVDHAVLGAAAAPNAGTTRAVIDRVSQAAALIELRDRLVGKGLLVDARHAATQVRHGLVPLGLLFATGAARWVDGVGDGRAQVVLAALLTATAALGRRLLVVHPVPTFLGARALAEHRTTTRRVPH